MVNQVDLFQTNGTLLLSKNDINISQKKHSAAKADFPMVLDAAYQEQAVDTEDTSYNDLEIIFEQAAKTYQISSDLLKAVAKAESDFDSNCVSSSGAMGIMQLMPETAKSLGVTDAFDPEQNIMGGAKYLAENLKIYNGDVSLALAAYNAGRGNVSKYGGIPPFKETQNYVKKVLAYMEEAIDVPDIRIDSVEHTLATFTSQEETALDTTSGRVINGLEFVLAKNNNADYLQEISEQLLAQSGGSLRFYQLTENSERTENS